MPRTVKNGHAATGALMPALDALTTESLKDLQSSDERRLLDVVDKLRRVGLNGTLELPQLVVCGDQSSGKSSVLEAITEIPFPRKAGLCTRFATEIVLRRQASASATIKINPSKFRTEDEISKLCAFSKTITDFANLPDVIEQATKAMGLGKVGESKAFSRDVLSVEICGPSRPQLTLVDLPGLIHSATKASTDADKDLIFNIVQEYMENPRTIILAVVSAKNDAANQIILTLFKKIDQKGSRTLGIITKPDCISADDEQFWFDLMLNKEVFLERGWHMVKNRSEVEMSFDFQTRNEAEKVFFEQGRFKKLPRLSVGIDTLRSRLSTILLRHLVQELPSLKKEMEEKYRINETELAWLGDRRETSQEQRISLMGVSVQINQIITAAFNGHYRHEFFEKIETDLPTTAGTNIRRFRAVIHDLNSRFAESMRLRGHSYQLEHAKRKRDDGVEEGEIREPPTAADTPEVESKITSKGVIDDGVPPPKKLKHQQSVQLVKDMILRCRGQELPGGVNPEVTSHLFWNQSERWKAICDSHIQTVHEMCTVFIKQVLEYAAPPQFRKPLQDLVITVALDDALEEGKKELQKLLDDKARHPSTYNHYYSDIIQQRRYAKYKESSDQARDKAIRKVQFPSAQEIFDRDVYQKEMGKIIEVDMATFSAEEALESERAYYKDELKYFIHAVTKQVVERCMIAPLPSRILNPVNVVGMTDEEVAFVAADPPETSAQRAFLEERKEMLDKGFEIFREAMGGFKPKMGKN